MSDDVKPLDPEQAAAIARIRRLMMIASATTFIAIAVVLRAIEAFKTFGSIYVLTTGGPGDSTEVINLTLYRIGLQNFDVGAAAALGLIFLLFLASIMGRLLNVLGRNTDLLEE